MEACAVGRDDLVQLLIDHGSCVADTDNSNWNSLTHCAANGHIRAANVVMRHLKYDKDSQEKLKEIISGKKEDSKTAKKKDKNTKVASPDLEDYDEADSVAESALAIAAHKGENGPFQLAGIFDWPQYFHWPCFGRSIDWLIDCFELTCIFFCRTIRIREMVPLP